MDKKAEAAKRLKEREAAARKRFKLPEGETTFRLLPNAKGTDKKEFAEYAMHSNVGPRKGYVRCGKNSEGGGECWLCDTVIPKLEQSDKSSKRKAAEEMARVEKFAVQIAVKDDDDNWTGPFLWEMPNSIANSLLGMLAKRDLANPEKGYNLTISRSGTGFTSTKYGNLERDDEKSEAPEKIIERLKTFGEIIKKYNEEAMKAAYYGHEQDEEEEEEAKPKKPVEEEEEERPAKKPKKPAEEEEEPEEKPSKKPKKPVDEDDLDGLLEDDTESSGDADVPDLDDELEEKPAKKPAKKPKHEEEEESEPEEEQEEKPAKKPKKPAEEEEEEEHPKKPAKKPSKSDDDDDF